MRRNNQAVKREPKNGSSLISFVQVQILLRSFPFMTPEQIQRNKHFLRDLRANKVQTMNKMRDRISGGRCCLCVALDTAVSEGFDATGHVDVHFPPVKLREWYGWETHNPILSNGLKASEINDANISHATIATLFEKTFLTNNPEVAQQVL